MPEQYGAGHEEWEEQEVEEDAALFGVLACYQDADGAALATMEERLDQEVGFDDRNDATFEDIYPKDAMPEGPQHVCSGDEVV